MGSHSNNHNNDDYYGGLSPETFSPVLFSREKNIFCRLEIKSMAAKRERKTFPDWNRNGENLGWGLRPSFIFSRLSRRVLIVTHPVFNQFLFLFLKSLPRFFVPLGRCNLNWPIRRFSHIGWATIWFCFTCGMFGISATRWKQVWVTKRVSSLSIPSHSLSPLCSTHW